MIRKIPANLWSFGWEEKGGDRRGLCDSFLTKKLIIIFTFSNLADFQRFYIKGRKGLAISKVDSSLIDISYWLLMSSDVSKYLAFIV